MDDLPIGQEGEIVGLRPIWALFSSNPTLDLCSSGTQLKGAING